MLRPRSTVFPVPNEDSDSDSDPDVAHVPDASENRSPAPSPVVSYLSDSGSETDVGLRQFEEIHEVDDVALRLPGFVQVGSSTTSHLESDPADDMNVPAPEDGLLVHDAHVVPDGDRPALSNNSSAASQSLASSGHSDGDVTQVPVSHPADQVLTNDPSLFAVESDHSLTSAAVRPSPAVSSAGSLTSYSDPGDVSTPISSLIPAAASTPAHPNVDTSDATSVGSDLPIVDRASVVGGGGDVSRSNVLGIYPRQQCADAFF